MTSHARYRESLRQFIQFGLVGGSGVLVNQAVLVLCNIIGRDVAHVSDQTIFVDLPYTDFNVRNYHVWAMIAFLAANLYNFVLNRYWTFRSANRAPFWREYLPFLTVGLIAQAIGMLLLTGLMHPSSPIGLPDSVFDGSSGLRTKIYWANLIMIICTMPVNFLVNKLWTFRAVRKQYGRQSVAAAEQEESSS